MQWYTNHCGLSLLTFFYVLSWFAAGVQGLCRQRVHHVVLHICASFHWRSALAAGELVLSQVGLIPARFAAWWLSCCCAAVGRR